MALTPLQYSRLQRYAGQAESIDGVDLGESIKLRCDNCNAVSDLKVASLIRKSIHPPFICKKCRCNSTEFKQKIANVVRARWQTDCYNIDVNKRRTDGNWKEQASARSKSYWADLAYRSKVTGATDYGAIGDNVRMAMADPLVVAKVSAETKKRWGDPVFREKISNIAKQNWRDPAYAARVADGFTDNARARIAEIARISWANPEYRLKQAAIRSKPQFQEKWAKSVADSAVRVSSIQATLYSMLDDLGVRYFREHNNGPDDPQCVIGPYSFDCVVPRSNRPLLLIEVQGEYWHSSVKAIRRDAAKASYIANNFPGQYELKYIWEHEFLSQNKVIELLKYWLKIGSPDMVEYSFSDILVKRCQPEAWRLLLSKYHYLPNAGRGGIVYGAYLGQELAAVCVFSPLIRQNIETNGSDYRELSRLCINPKYQKKNFASWFVSRCIKSLDRKYKWIIAYCDTTFNHDGAAYKACNFELDSRVKPDYWYVAEDGWVTHKKTLYNHAVKMHMTEKNYAATHKYTKIWGMEKLKFIFER